MAEQPDRRRLEAKIDGRVQGVGFRYFVQREANSLGLSGWVRNLRSGSVQLAAEGPEEDLNSLIEAVRQGPPMSHVQNIDARWKQPKGESGAFETRYTV